jgi:hypothetical protein
MIVIISPPSRLSLLKESSFTLKKEEEDDKYIFLAWFQNYSLVSKYSFETRPGGSIRDPADLRLKLDQVEEKTGEGKTRRDPADSTG